MSLANYSSFVAYDNPFDLVHLCFVCILRNIEHFVNEENSSGRSFYIWKDGISFSDATLEQLFQIAINYRGELDECWITLFLGSRWRARQLIDSLGSFPSSGNKPDLVYSKHDNGVLSSVTFAESPLPIKVELNQVCTITPSNFNGPNSPVFLRVMPSSKTYLQPAVKNLEFTSRASKQSVIDSTGVLKRVVIRYDVSIPEPALIAGLLEFSEPVEITLEDCSTLDSKLKIFELIAAKFSSLITLKLYRSGTLFTQYFSAFSLNPRTIGLLMSGFDLSHLRVLALHDLPAAATSPQAKPLLEHLADRLSAHLLQLDISGANLSSCHSFEWLSRLRNLHVLILADCQLPSDRSPLIAAICTLSQLIRLDLAHLGGLQSDPAEKSWIPFQVDVFEHNTRVLRRLSEKLPQLDHLDISGTNLPGVIQEDSYKKEALPGWPSYHKLSFLGLWGCPANVCRRENLPSHLIAGDANEAQLCAALDVYADRPQATCMILSALVNMLSASTSIRVQSKQRCLQLLLERMQRYSRHKLMQISSSELLFNLILQIGIENLSSLQGSQLVQRLTDTLERFPHEDTIVHNCSLTLCKVRTYDKIISLTKKLLQVILNITEHVLNIPFYSFLELFELLKTIVRQLSVSEKHLFGDVGGVNVTLSILKQRLQNAYYDDLILHTWVLLCSATDKTPSNCRMFIDLYGLELFVCYIKRWTGRYDLYRAMLIVVGNIAQVKCLRCYLKTDLLIALFLELLYTSDANDISYNTACVLSFMLADGEDLWYQKGGCDDVPLPPVALAYSRATISKRIIAVIDKWNPNDESFEGYISVPPILSLITTFDSFASQYWAAWVLNNLSLVNPDVYCPMLFREGTLELLVTTIADARSPVNLRYWLVLTADRIREYIREQNFGDRSGLPSPHVSLIAEEKIPE